MFTTVVLFPGFAFAQDHSNKLNDNAQFMKAEFENDAVQVVRILMAPHQKIPMHETTPRVVIWVSGGRLKLTFPNGKAIEEEHHAGETAWLGAQKHAGENLGSKPIEFIAVIPKR
jgi:quercetin dioxygenase-like cupin family protein